MMMISAPCSSSFIHIVAGMLCIKSCKTKNIAFCLKEKRTVEVETTATAFRTNKRETKGWKEINKNKKGQTKCIYKCINLERELIKSKFITQICTLITPLYIILAWCGVVLIFACFFYFLFFFSFFISFLSLPFCWFIFIFFFFYFSSYLRIYLFIYLFVVCNYINFFFIYYVI